MQIANPIYDVVFKYMMNDNKVAKLLLSAIIGQKIVKLKFEPRELNLSLQESITVLRMDFKATVQYVDKSEQVIIIELQKAKLPTDIMRFRRYLGEQYVDPNNSREIKPNRRDGNTLKKAFPILSIYFLGHPLKYSKNIPVIKVARKYYDLGTGNELTEKEEFIESLTHDSYVIQIPYVHGRKRTELEQLLHIFDQDATTGQPHLLEISEEEIPKQYRPILNRLQQAFLDRKIQEAIHVEEEIIEHLQDYSRIIEGQKKKIEAGKKEIEAGKKEIEAGKKEIEEKDRVILEIQKNQDEKTKIAILNLIRMDFSNKQIETVLNISLKTIERVRKENS